MNNIFAQCKVLVLDDENVVLRQLFSSLSIDNIEIDDFIDELDGIDKLVSASPDVLIVSVTRPQLIGMGIINYIKKHQLPIAVIAVSNDANPETTASCIRAGATDFLNIPVTEEKLLHSVEQSLESVFQEQSSNNLTHELYDESEFGFIGAGQSMLEVSKLIISAAKSDASVFITGENGTGKEVCAQLIHRLSNRRENRLVPVNCAAIPHSLAESEIFGHVKGAFTGAHEDREGVASLANGGTLFLDEIGEMDIDLQSKLLRFVQSGMFNRVGSGRQEQVNVRFICATNREPYEQIEQGKFRQDLFYRLNVIQIHLPPLRNRGDDVLVFARNFLASFAKEEGKHFTSFSSETENLLKSYSWPGNVRELQNVIKSIVVLHDGDTVIPSMLPLAIIRDKGDRRRSTDRLDLSQRLDSINNALSFDAADMPSDEEFNGLVPVPPVDRILPLDTVVNNAIRDAIKQCGGNIVEAAHHLGVSASTIYRKLKKRAG